MVKKWKIIIAVLVAVVVLAGGAIAVVAEGQQQQQAAAVSANTTLAKVAGILGIPESQLTSAVKQAEKELRDEALTKALDTAVKNGKLTQAQADQFKTWWSQRPSGLDAGPLPRGIGGMGMMRGLAIPQVSSNETLARIAKILNIPVDKVTAAFQQARVQVSNDRLAAMLDKAVANGRLTQDQANQMKSWWASRPAGVGNGPFVPGFRGRMPGRQMMGGMRGSF